MICRSCKETAWVAKRCLWVCADRGLPSSMPQRGAVVTAAVHQGTLDASARFNEADIENSHQLGFGSGG